MKAAPLTQKPAFPLMKQGDIQTIYHLQMPRWLFTDPRYTALALETKVAYTFLLNRFQLSRLNGWVNEDGAVFIIYTRRSLAEEMQVSYRKIIEAMKELSAAGLIWEKRCGRGDANQIYLALVEHPDTKSGSAPFVGSGHEAAGGRPEAEPGEPDTAAPVRSAEPALLDPPSPGEEIAVPTAEVPIQHLQRCGTGTSTGAGTALPEVRKWHPNYKEKRNTELNHIKVSQSVYGAGGRADAEPESVPFRAAYGMSEQEQLAQILENCELEIFDPDTAKVFAHAIELLFYSDNFRIGKAILPQASVRSRLWELDGIILQSVQGKLRNNQRDVKNSTAYTMAVIFNTITESQSDLLVDPYLNSLNALPTPQRDK
ncbi:MAG: replication initiator protein A [Ruminococcus flavefaciens]|nr:replication initiator protein A [Ruminococcus flavefaciens]